MFLRVNEIVLRRFHSYKMLNFVKGFANFARFEVRLNATKIVVSEAFARFVAL